MSSPSSDGLRRRVVASLVLIFVFLAVGSAAFVALWKLKKDPERVDKVPPRTAVRVVVAERGPFREILEGYGSARAIRASDVAAEVSGVVAAISPELEAGSAVAEGAELVRLDRRDFEQRVASAKARAKQARAAVERFREDIESLARRLALAKEDFEASIRELERTRDLVEEGVETKSALDRQVSARSAKERAVAELEARESSAKQDLIGAEAEVEAAAAALVQTENDLGRTVVHAPYAGRIEARHARLGARVAPGTPLFSIVDLARIEVPVALGASRFGEVAVGAKARVRLREGGPVVWEGAVARVSPSVDARDRTFLVYLEVHGEAGDAPVPPGAFVLAEIEGLLHDDVIALPRAAFVEDDVYVAEPAGSEEWVVREVRPTVRRVLPNATLVTAGIEPGDRVVVTSLEQIADGSRVILVDEGDGTGGAPGRLPGEDVR